MLNSNRSHILKRNVCWGKATCSPGFKAECLQTMDVFDPAVVRSREWLASLLRAETLTLKRLICGREPGAGQPFLSAASQRRDVAGAELLLFSCKMWVGRRQPPDGKRDFPAETA